VLVEHSLDIKDCYYLWGLCFLRRSNRQHTHNKVVLHYIQIQVMFLLADNQHMGLEQVVELVLLE
jgi:hypothetical protein